MISRDPQREDLLLRPRFGWKHGTDGTMQLGNMHDDMASAHWFLECSLEQVLQGNDNFRCVEPVTEKTEY
ncbi:hypothetical protein CR513_45928, partial [Mucuna pruriens]